MSETGHETVWPSQEPYRAAVRWVSLRRVESPQTPLRELVAQASTQFDLSAKEELSLLALVLGETTGE